MERSRGMEEGLRLVAMCVFLMAALLSTGCGENALMNPVSESSQAQMASANSAGHDVNPAKKSEDSAGHELNP